MPADFSIPVTIRNGFPLLAEGDLHPAEPDVGIMSEYIDNLRILTPRRQETHWLRLTPDELDEVEGQIFEHLLG